MAWSLTRFPGHLSRGDDERRFCDFKQWRGLATRYDNLAIVYRAATVLHAIIACTRRLRDTP